MKIKFLVMTKEEIYEYAIFVTRTNQRTILKFKDEKELVGYFDDNATVHNNNWNFILTGQDNKNEKIIINGDDLKSIEIKTIFEIKKNS